MILILIPNSSFRLHSFIVLVALKRAVLLDLGQCLNTDSPRIHFSFRKSFANVLQYFILSSKFFVDGFASISSAVDTSPVDFKCCCSHDFSCCLNCLSAREILVSITAEMWVYCSRKHVSNCLTSSVGPKMCSSARPCLV